METLFSILRVLAALALIPVGLWIALRFSKYPPASDEQMKNDRW